MKQKFLILIIIITSFLIITKSSYAASHDKYLTKRNRKELSSYGYLYRYPYVKGIEVKIIPERPEFIAGSIATFTVTLTNKNKYPINIEYPTGRHWDMVVYHNDYPIYRWSDGYTWEESPHIIPLQPNETRSCKLSWVSVNVRGEPLVQGIYKCVGLVTCSPKTIVSPEVDIRLIPPSIVPTEIIRTNLNQVFEIELPRFGGDYELEWKIVYRNNDNRISLTSKKQKDESIVISFLPRRIGHVEFDLYAYPNRHNPSVSLERRSYRIEVE